MSKSKKCAPINQTDLLGFDLEVAQNDSHISLKLIQQIPYMISGGNGPLEPLHQIGLLELPQDTVQLGDKLVGIMHWQASILEFLAQTFGRLAVALQELCQALLWVSADAIASCIPPQSRSRLTSSCGRQLHASALRFLISSGAWYALLMI